ncbi:MAG: NYN domain-containing protein [Rhizobiales bacterium]|nr:NYN domain-containing protein [Hyphomicrobiales bacterium]
MRRCYADPKLLGKARAAFTGQGFQIVDCPPLPGRERNSAEIHMVLDTIDALAHQTGFEEFILLSADSDLTPVIFRLRSYNRATSIYTTLTTSAGYRAIADGAIDEQALIALLAPTADAETPEATEDAEEENAQRPNGGERDGLAGLARRIHQATNVPLFAPRVYGELFRALTREVAENGYHFQTTAENVAARLSANGRNASRRQIAFVVKGLALKGHVFSTSDSPEKLAEAFKEQVLYLARNAGVEIDEGMETLISTWIVGRETGNAAADPGRPGLRAAARADAFGFTGACFAFARVGFPSVGAAAGPAGRSPGGAARGTPDQPAADLGDDAAAGPADPGPRHRRAGPGARGRGHGGSRAGREGAAPRRAAGRCGRRHAAIAAAGGAAHGSEGRGASPGARTGAAPEPGRPGIASGGDFLAPADRPFQHRAAACARRPPRPAGAGRGAGVASGPAAAGGAAQRHRQSDRRSSARAPQRRPGHRRGRGRPARSDRELDPRRDRPGGRCPG